MANREYEGAAVDGTVQYLGEAPYWQGDGETVDVVNDTETGEVTTEGVNLDPQPETSGQTTLDEWEWSACR
jgi:hypothetical protein